MLETLWLLDGDMNIMEMVICLESLENCGTNSYYGYWVVNNVVSYSILFLMALYIISRFEFRDRILLFRSVQTGY